MKHAEEYSKPDLSQFSEIETQRELESYGIKGIDFALRIPEELSADKESIHADIFWLRFQKPEDSSLPTASSVEGKLYIPKTATNEQLILFTPGFPGGNAGRFEQLYAKSFTDAGYSFFTLRHNGTNLLKPDTAPEILNSPKRMDLARAMSMEHIGGEKLQKPADIVEEPITPLVHLAPRYQKIHLMGQSMGVAASYNSISRLAGHPEVLDKVGNIVGIAGYIGKDKGTEGPLWDGVKMPIEVLAAYELGYIKKVSANTVTDKVEFMKSLKEVAERNSNMNIPDHIGNVLVFTPGDDIILGPDKSEENYLSEYGPVSAKKLIIRDETNLKSGKQHSMLWISPQNLLRAVEANVSSFGPHYIKVPNSAKGMIEKG